jgi:hypothetical protein
MKVPKFLETAFVFYPPLLALLIINDVIHFLRDQNIFSLTRLILSCYLLSPFSWWVLRLCFGQKTEGAFRVGKRAKDGNLWLLYYQLQLIYSSFSFFERLLRLFPGFYSAWMRLWGSKIGKKVNWTAECQIVDRGHLEIGDRAFLGNRCYLSAHALKKTKDQYLLYVKKIVIGSDAMVSYAVEIGPGVVIGARAHIDAGAGMYPNTRVLEGETYANPRRSTHTGKDAEHPSPAE